MADNSPKTLARRIAGLEKAVHALQNAPRKQDPESASHTSDANGKADGLPSVTPGLPDRNPTPRKNTETDKKWYQSFEWWKVRIEAIAFVAAIGYAIVTYQQWRDLRHNFTIDERAWIKVDSESEFDGPHRTDRNFLSMPLTLLNIGKTPAFNVHVLTSAAVLYNWQPPSFTYKEMAAPRGGHETTTGIIFQSVPVKVDGGSPAAITETQRALLSAGKAYMVFYGSATFDDVFGSRHETRFCVWGSWVQGVDSNASDCTEYNYADHK